MHGEHTGFGFRKRLILNPNQEAPDPEPRKIKSWIKVGPNTYKESEHASIYFNPAERISPYVGRL